MAYMTTTKTALSRLKTIQLKYHIPQAMALLLDLLLEQPVMSIEQLTAAGVGPTDVTTRVVVHRCRKFLEKQFHKSVEMESQYGLGYFLAPEAKKFILSDLYPGR